MNKRMKIELECSICKNKYLKDKSEYLRNLKLNRKNFCSLNCSSKESFERNLPKEKRSKYDISKHCYNLIDEYTNFRYVFKLLKTRMKKECLISLKDIKDLWEFQKGICPYTGIKLKLIKHGYKYKNISNNRFEIASLDRIDSSKGYIKGNLCFVSTMINFMKNNLTVEETVAFIFIMKEYLKDKTDNDIVCAVKKFTE